jgi:PhzF family phenazine biosynthesis protein
MTTQLYIVDSFTDKLFSGNPAAVCVLDEWVHDEVLQKIASENNLSETAFFLARDTSPYLRWFTPGAKLASPSTSPDEMLNQSHHLKLFLRD